MVEKEVGVIMGSKSSGEASEVTKGTQGSKKLVDQGIRTFSKIQEFLELGD